MQPIKSFKYFNLLKMVKKFYVVIKGRETGIFNSWLQCKKQINAYSNAVYQGFDTESEAIEYFEKNKSPTDKIETKKRKIDEIEDSSSSSEDDKDSDYHEESGEDEEKKSKKKKIKKINVYTDGSCLNNGKENAKGGIGIYFEGNVYENISQVIDSELNNNSDVYTNNRAELIAIRECIKKVKDDDDLVIHTDSKYSILGITGVNKINVNQDLFNDISKLIKERKGTTEFKKVKGHSGKDDGNKRADELARNSYN